MSPSVTYTYDITKDVWCLLHKGKSSNNSSLSTKQYRLLEERYGNNLDDTAAEQFIAEYLLECQLSITAEIHRHQSSFKRIEEAFHTRAQDIFNISLPHPVTAYLTINSRCPYNIAEHYFYTAIESVHPEAIAMHELWHFYTWYGLGIEEESRLGAARYNEIKEALTVLLNVTCSDLLPPGVQDTGYPQHQALRAQIVEYWTTNPNTKDLWRYLQKAY